jgi:hypothetical protein
MAEKHKWTRTHLRDVHLDAVGGDKLVLYFQVTPSI